MKTKKFTFSGILLSTAERCSTLGRDSWVSDLRTYGNNILIERRVKLTGPETRQDLGQTVQRKITNSRGSAVKPWVTTAEVTWGWHGASPEESQGEGPSWGLQDVSEEDGARDGAVLSHVTQNIAVRRAGGGGGTTLQR